MRGVIGMMGAADSGEERMMLQGERAARFGGGTKWGGKQLGVRMR